MPEIFSLHIILEFFMLGIIMALYLKCHVLENKALEDQAERRFMSIESLRTQEKAIVDILDRFIPKPSNETFVQPEKEENRLAIDQEASTGPHGTYLGRILRDQGVVPVTAANKLKGEPKSMRAEKNEQVQRDA